MVEVLWSKVVDTGSSVKFRVEIRDGSGETVFDKPVTLSRWQVDDGGFENRLRQMAVRRVSGVDGLDDVEVVER